MPDFDQPRSQNSWFRGLKMSFFCIFGPFLGPNGPFRLFSHHILCPTGPMEEKKICDTLPLMHLFLSMQPQRLGINRGYYSIYWVQKIGWCFNPGPRWVDNKEMSSLKLCCFTCSRWAMTNFRLTDLFISIGKSCFVSFYLLFCAHHNIKHSIN